MAASDATKMVAYGDHDSRSSVLQRRQSASSTPVVSPRESSASQAARRVAGRRHFRDFTGAPLTFVAIFVHFVFGPRGGYTVPCGRFAHLFTRFAPQHVPDFGVSCRLHSGIHLIANNAVRCPQFRPLCAMIGERSG
jgi:hypothetical protein